MIGHDEDILSIAYSPPNLLATSGYDGKLCVWNMDSGILSITHHLVRRISQLMDAPCGLIFLRNARRHSFQAQPTASSFGMKEGCLVWEHSRTTSKRGGGACD